MVSSEISEKVANIQSEIKAMLSSDGLEPCETAGLESALAHIDLLCIELGLDVK